MIVNVIAEKDHQLKGQNQGKDCSIALESRLLGVLEKKLNTDSIQLYRCTENFRCLNSRPLHT